MSEQPAEYGIWAFDLSDRMRKALRVSGVSVQEMADYLDVTRGTVSTWINGKIAPSTQSVRLWALRTGAPYEWLVTGDMKNAPSPDGERASSDVARVEGFEPPTF